jgi:hypothetical protein
MSRRPILMVNNAGYGETPVPTDALFQPGELITAARHDAPTAPVEVVCLAVVPKGCCVDYAMADQATPRQPRPLMIRSRKAYGETVYVLQFPADEEPRIYTQSEMVAGQGEAEAAEG